MRDLGHSSDSLFGNEASRFSPKTGRAGLLSGAQPALSPPAGSPPEPRLSGVAAARLKPAELYGTTSHQQEDRSADPAQDRLPSARDSCPLCLVAIGGPVLVQPLQINRARRNLLREILGLAVDGCFPTGGRLCCFVNFDRGSSKPRLAPTATPLPACVLAPRSIALAHESSMRSFARVVAGLGGSLAIAARIGLRSTKEGPPTFLRSCIRSQLNCVCPAFRQVDSCRSRRPHSSWKQADSQPQRGERRGQPIFCGSGDQSQLNLCVPCDLPAVDFLASLVGPATKLLETGRSQRTVDRATPLISLSQLKASALVPKTGRDGFSRAPPPALVAADRLLSETLGVCRGSLEHRPNLRTTSHQLKEIEPDPAQDRCQVSRDLRPLCLVQNGGPSRSTTPDNGLTNCENFLWNSARRPESSTGADRHRCCSSISIGLIQRS